MDSISNGSALNIEFKNGSGDIQVTGNYASSPNDGLFTISPKTGELFNLLSLSIDMRLTAPINVTEYGLGTALSAGIKIYGEPAFDSAKFSAIVIKTNQDFEKYFTKENSLSDAVYMGEYRLFMKFGAPIVLKARKKKVPDKIIIKSTENLTTRFTGSTCSFMAHGNWESI